MAELIDSLAQVVKTTVRERSSALMRHAQQSLELQNDPLALGMLALMQKMAHFIDSSFDLLDAQLSESHLQQDVLKLEKELLEKKLAQLDK